MTSRPLKTFTRATHSAGLFEDSDRRELVMNDGQHCRPLLIPPESGFSHSGISPKDLDALLLAREEGARPPSPRLSSYDGVSWSWLAPSGIPPPRERIDPDRPEGRHPISRATHSGCIRGPQRAPRGAQAVHPLRVRGRPRHLEGASAQNQEGKAVLHPVPSSTHVEGGEPVLLARPGDRTNPNPDPGDGRSSAALAALRVAPLDPRRLIVGPRIPHGCPGEGYRRPAEGGAEAVRAPRGGRSPWTRTKIPSMGFRHRAIRRGCFAYRSTPCVGFTISHAHADGNSPARRTTKGRASGSFS